jgi:hypothetical protein
MLYEMSLTMKCHDPTCSGHPVEIKVQKHFIDSSPR